MNSPTTSIARDAYQIKLISSQEEFQSLEPAWNSILSKLRNANFFMSFEWMWTWWNCLQEGKELLLLVVDDGDRTVAIAPLMRVTRTIPAIHIPFKEVRFVSTVSSADSASSFAGTLDFLIAPGHEGAREALVWHLLNDLVGFNCLRLHPVPEDSPTLRLFKEIGERLGVAVNVEKVIENACLRITEDWDTYYSKRKKKLRAKLRHLHKVFYNNSGIECVEFKEPAVLGEAYRGIIEVEAQSWKPDGGVAITDERYHHFYFDLAKALSEKGWLRIFILQVENKPIAYEYCVDYYGHIVGLKASYDRSYERFAPGKYLIPTVFEKFFREGAKEIDLLWGNLEFKQNWTSDVYPRFEVSFFDSGPYSRFIRAIMTSKLLHGMWDRFWDWRRE
jgi:CelD/BcsL family acetyltransferase involved in cellulose biosynthesis